jgi:Leucine-rich repeat (LRR) protein
MLNLFVLIASLCPVRGLSFGRNKSFFLSDLLVFLYFLSPVRGATIPSQIHALEILYNSTDGGTWKWKNELLYGPIWSFTSPQQDPCYYQKKTWQGITCSSAPNICQFQDCQIISLSLEGYGLKRNLPSEMFVDLTSLTSFEVSKSPLLAGTIPSTIGSLMNLEDLRLFLLNITGVIPSSLGSLSQLVYVDLNTNHLTGAIPSELGSLSRLEFLNLFINDLTGAIPSALASLSRVKDLYLSNNLLTGTIPPTLGSLSQLVYLYLYNNLLIGTIPPTLGSLSQLVYLFVSINYLTGTIPSALSSLSRLEYLDFPSNLLTGAIPTALGSLSRLKYLSLTTNYLARAIPSVLGSLSQLRYLDLCYNLLTGAIPQSLGSSSQLSYLSLFNNDLTGVLPSALGSLSLLEYIYLSNNHLNGTVPSTLGSLPHLAYLYLDHNDLTGNIPSSLGSLSQLEYLSLYHNHFTGAIPSALSRLSGLLRLYLDHNHLQGSLPFSLESFPLLKQLFLHQNQLTGRLHELFPSAPLNQSLSPQLINLDVSDNLFTGSIPSTLFLPQLQVISLSLNCFSHNLPTSICEAVNAEVISMDGLGSAKDCDGIILVPLTSLSGAPVSLVQSMSGDIPDCVWMMSKLQTLNLAGNGLNGVIGKTASMPLLSSMTLSHNYLSGTIPLWLQQKNISHLDLSHNKLIGTVDGFTTPPRGPQSSGLVLTLSVNRLSGQLSKSLETYHSLDILSGNLFGCTSVPNNDQNSKSWSCGSEEYDQSMMLLGGVWGLVVCSVMCLSVWSLIFNNTPRDLWSHVDRLIGYMRYYRDCSLPQSCCRFTISFGNLLIGLMKSLCLLAAISILLSAPIYLLKEFSVSQGDSDYVTHTDQYQWLWTTAFVSGNIPAAIFMVVDFLCLALFDWIIVHLGDRTEQQETSDPQISSLPPSPSLLPSQRQKSRRDYWLMATVWFIFFVDTTVVGTVNGLYIASTLQDISPDARLWTQVSFGFFSIVWILFLHGLIPSKIKESRYGVWLLMCLYVMNSVIIPCLATALSSPTCYQVSVSPLIISSLSQRLLVPPDNISSSYSYRSCSTSFVTPDGLKCTEYRTVFVDVLPITPPFAFSYQCGSTLLTSYLPVYLYSTSLQTLVLILKLLGILIFSNSTLHPTRWPLWAMKWFPGIYWPSQGTHCGKMFPSSLRLIRPAQIISSTMNQIILLLSFGLCSPVLCGSVTLNLSLQLSSWLLLIGRFLFLSRESSETVIPSPIESSATSTSLPFRLEEPHEDHEASPEERNDENLTIEASMKTLDGELCDVNSYLPVCKWPVILTSSLFTTLLCWEIAGDGSGGWLGALWVPIVGVSMVLVIWIWDRVLSGYLSRDHSLRHISTSDGTQTIEVVVRSSLHMSSTPGHETEW